MNWGHCHNRCNSKRNISANFTQTNANLLDISQVSKKIQSSFSPDTSYLKGQGNFFLVKGTYTVHVHVHVYEEFVNFYWNISMGTKAKTRGNGGNCLRCLSEVSGLQLACVFTKAVPGNWVPGYLTKTVINQFHFFGSNYP